MTTPLDRAHSREATSGTDMEKEMPTAHHEQEESRAMSSMFADAALATGTSSPVILCLCTRLTKIEKEHKMTLLEGVRLYPKAIAWAALIAMCCAMEGYDIALIGNFYAFPPFNEKYGDLQPDGSYQVPARWQAGLANGAQCGQIIGLLSKWQSGRA